VNGKIQPYLNVYKRRYRFRLLDGGPSRFYRFHLSNNQPLIQISSDGNLLPSAIPTTTGIQVGVAERVDVIVDFTNAVPGSRIYLQNRLPQTKGEGPDGTRSASGAVTDLVEFRVQGNPPQPDLSLVPTTLIPNPIFQNASSKTRSFVFDKSRDGLWVINDQLFDPNVISFQIRQNRTETWNLDGRSRDWSHPVHIHFEEFRVMKRDGSASAVAANERGRKDVVAIGNFHLSAEIKMQFRDWLGHYPMHCHNTVHEDHAMMLRWEIIP
jgi:FtsP/CotA-like multicopper oxidase with cupredoxin domain